MASLGFKNPSILPAVGGGWIFAAKEAFRYKGVVKEGKAQLEVFSGLIKNIACSVHGRCKWLKRVGYSFKNLEEEIETLIQIVEVAFPVIEENFGAYGVPIIGIVYPPFDEENFVQEPIILRF